MAAGDQTFHFGHLLGGLPLLSVRRTLPFSQLLLHLLSRGGCGGFECFLDVGNLCFYLLLSSVMVLFVLVGSQNLLLDAQQNCFTAITPFMQGLDNIIDILLSDVTANAEIHFQQLVSLVQLALMMSV